MKYYASLAILLCYSANLLGVYSAHTCPLHGSGTSTISSITATSNETASLGMAHQTVILEEQPVYQFAPPQMYPPQMYPPQMYPPQGYPSQFYPPVDSNTTPLLKPNIADILRILFLQKQQQDLLVKEGPEWQPPTQQTPIFPPWDLPDYEPDYWLQSATSALTPSTLTKTLLPSKVVWVTATSGAVSSTTPSTISSTAAAIQSTTAATLQTRTLTVSLKTFAASTFSPEPTGRTTATVSLLTVPSTSTAIPISTFLPSVSITSLTRSSISIQATVASTFTTAPATLTTTPTTPPTSPSSLLPIMNIVPSILSFLQPLFTIKSEVPSASSTTVPARSMSQTASIASVPVTLTIPTFFSPASTTTQSIVPTDFPWPIDGGTIIPNEPAPPFLPMQPIIFPQIILPPFLNHFTPMAYPTSSSAATMTTDQVITLSTSIQTMTVPAVSIPTVTESFVVTLTPKVEMQKAEPGPAPSSANVPIAQPIIVPQPVAQAVLQPGIVAPAGIVAPGSIVQQGDISISQLMKALEMLGGQSIHLDPHVNGSTEKVHLGDVVHNPNDTPTPDASSSLMGQPSANISQSFPQAISYTPPPNISSQYSLNVSGTRPGFPANFNGSLPWLQQLNPFLFGGDTIQFLPQAGMPPNFRMINQNGQPVPAGMV